MIQRVAGNVARSGSTGLGRSPAPRLAGDAGISLLEILVVVAIMGLLATVAGVQLSGVLGRARSDTARLQLEQVGATLEMFRLDVGRYPDDGEGLRALLSAPSNVATWRGPYLRKPEAIVDPWGRPLAYRPGEDGQSFQLMSLGADGRPGGDGENRDVQFAR